ncbi:hypothetical protein NX059_006633 [Plenodomus lindquistii]|nr:hypothetical protein NX059_006633 [Plenodomus lindquistii]
MASARTYQQWMTAAEKLDHHMGYRGWQPELNKLYDRRVIGNRYDLLVAARNEYNSTPLHSLINIVNIVRTGLIRGFANIVNPELYNRAFSGTTPLIEDYVQEMATAIRIIVDAPTSDRFTDTQKEETIDGFKRSFGHSALVLQGGATFVMCHLGVVKALLERRLLPRCVVGSSASALIAALVGVHTHEELPGCLTAANIDITAFTDRPYRRDTGLRGRLATLFRRLKRWWRVGHFIDYDVLEKVLKANLGNVTFQEAYRRTGTALNIIVTSRNGDPVLLNYLSAPYVFVWSAALASNVTTSNATSCPVTIMSQNWDKSIVPWDDPSMSSFQPPGSRPRHKAVPLQEVRVKFNVNHFIISKAQPYLVPLLRADLHEPNPFHRGFRKYTIIAIRGTYRELLHSLSYPLRFAPRMIWPARLVYDEIIPGPNISLVPKLERTDFLKLIDHPSPAMIDYFIFKGERSVWPVVKALNTRCAIEMALDDASETIHPRRPRPATNGSSSGVAVH